MTGGRSGSPASIRLHSSWTGLLTAYVGGALAVVIVVFLFADYGVTTVSVVLGLIALALLAVVVFDVPISAEFTDEGVTRRALGRRHHLPWIRIDRLERMRVGVLRTSRSRGGGLVARIGSRRYVLVDRMEGPIEFDDLRAVLGRDRADAFGLTRELRPPDDRSPTWLYRRRVWRPDGI